MKGEIDNELSDEKMIEIAEIITKNQLFFVTFTGGEPLLRQQLLFQISRYLSKAGVLLSLNTNLILMNDEVLKNLQVHRILISCPAADEAIYHEITGGYFADFETKLKMVIAAGIDFTVNMVVSKSNYHLIRQMAISLAKIGVKCFAATPASLNAGCPNFNLLLSRPEITQAIQDLVWAHEEFGLAVDIMEAIPKCVIPKRAFELYLPFIYRSCRAGQRNGTISINGDVRPCSHNPEVFGNLLKDDIGLIWDQMQNWRKQIGNPHLNCLSCDIFSHCGGGCSLDVVACQHLLDGKHPYMADNVESVAIKPKPISFKPDVIIRPCSTFQYRKENNGWLVSSGSSRNIIEINNSLYQFLMATRGQLPMSLAILAQKFGTTFDNPEYQRVMTNLIQKKYFLIEG